MLAELGAAAITRDEWRAFHGQPCRGAPTAPGAAAARQLSESARSNSDFAMLGSDRSDSLATIGTDRSDSIVAVQVAEDSFEDSFDGAEDRSCRGF